MSIGGHAVAGARAAWAQAREPDERPRSPRGRRMAEHHEHQQAGMDLMGWVDRWASAGGRMDLSDRADAHHEHQRAVSRWVVGASVGGHRRAGWVACAEGPAAGRRAISRPADEHEGGRMSIGGPDGWRGIDEHRRAGSIRHLGGLRAGA